MHHRELNKAQLGRGRRGVGGGGYMDKNLEQLHTSWENAMMNDRDVALLAMKLLKDSAAGMHSAGALSDIQQHHDCIGALQAHSHQRM